MAVYTSSGSNGPNPTYSIHVPISHWYESITYAQPQGMSTMQQQPLQPQRTVAVVQQPPRQGQQQPPALHQSPTQHGCASYGATFKTQGGQQGACLPETPRYYNACPVPAPIIDVGGPSYQQVAPGYAVATDNNNNGCDFKVEDQDVMDYFEIKQSSSVQRKIGGKKTRRVREQLHTGEKPFTCKICVQKFSSQVAVLKHKKDEHPEYHYTCPYCEKVYVKENMVYKHMVITHAHEKRY